MAIIIDGYNLLHVTGIFGHGRARSSLERSRRALLDFLLTALDREELSVTTVVFDAADAPRGLPRVTRQAGLTIHFASEYEDADTLIEELIRACAAPRQLVVVSSDHRIQRAARRRKAEAIDSERWYDEIVQRQHQREQTPEPTDAKRQLPLDTNDVQHWVEEFGDLDDVTQRQLEEDLKPQSKRPLKTPGPAPAKKKSRRPKKPKSDRTPPDKSGDEFNIGNPFPPGYADDLFDDLDS